MPESLNYCFISSGSWKDNAAHIRPRHLGAELIERGHRVTYIVDDVPFNRTSLNLHPRANIAFVPKTRGLGQVSSRRRVVREVNPDYMHLLNPYPKTSAAMVGNDIPVIADWDEPPFIKHLGLVQNTLASSLTWWLRRRAVLHIACTKPLQEYMQQRWNIQPVYIPHAPYLTQYPDGASPFTAPTFVYMGNYFPAWDHDILFEAALILKRRGIEPHMLFMGHGPDHEKWKSFVAEHGLSNVDAGGFTTGQDLWLRLRHAQVLLFPIRDNDMNRWRCPSKVFAYAQARRPIITSRIGEVPYMLGDLPIYIDSTPQAFADQMEKLMGQNLSDVNYDLSKHSWSDRADRLLAAIRSLKKD